MVWLDPVWLERVLLSDAAAGKLAPPLEQKLSDACCWKAASETRMAKAEKPLVQN